MIVAGTPADCSAAGFLIFDADFRTVWANETLAGFFGLRREELIGQDRARLVHALQGVLENAAHFAETILEGMRRGVGEAFDHRVLPGGGRRERWLSCRSLAIESGPFAGGWIVQHVDVTDGRRLRFLLEGGRVEETGAGPERIAESRQSYSSSSGALRPADLSLAPPTRLSAFCDLGRPEPLSSPDRDRVSPLLPAVRNPVADTAHPPEPCRELLDRIDLGVLLMDAARTVVFVNRAAERLCGQSPRSLIGQKCFSALAARSRPCPSCPGTRAVASGRPCTDEVERPFDGSVRALLLKAFPMPGGAFAVLVDDITERKRGEDRLRAAFAEAGRSREWIDSILRSVVDGLIVTDRKGRVLLMNAASESLLGVRQHPLFQADLEDCIAERRLLKRLREAVTEGEDGGRFEYEIGAGPAGVRVLTVDISQVRDEKGESEGTVFLLRDITHERELDRMKNEFISTAAHELRTPLTSILGFSELLLTRKDLSPEQREDFLTFIHQKAENLSRIISDLLDVSRIEAGRGLELYRERCEINRLLRETVEPYRKCSDKHDLEVVLPAEEAILNVDRGKIIQVLENLLSNAFKYSPKGGRIRVTASRARGAYLISVEDQGIGMGREQIARAFDKFYRGDSSNGAVEGTGLGLSITKYIVEAHGGRIWLESRRGRGTTASFTLPLPPDQGM